MVELLYDLLVAVNSTFFNKEFQPWLCQEEAEKYLASYLAYEDENQVVPYLSAPIGRVMSAATAASVVSEGNEDCGEQIQLSQKYLAQRRLYVISKLRAHHQVLAINSKAINEQLMSLHVDGIDWLQFSVLVQIKAVVKILSEHDVVKLLVIDNADLTEAKAADLSQDYERYSKQGYRLLLIASEQLTLECMSEIKEKYPGIVMLCTQELVFFSDVLDIVIQLLKKRNKRIEKVALISSDVQQTFIAKEIHWIGDPDEAIEYCLPDYDYRNIKIPIGLFTAAINIVGFTRLESIIDNCIVGGFLRRHPPEVFSELLGFVVRQYLQQKGSQGAQVYFLKLGKTCVDDIIFYSYCKERVILYLKVLARQLAIHLDLNARINLGNYYSYQFRDYFLKECRIEREDLEDSRLKLFSITDRGIENIRLAIEFFYTAFSDLNSEWQVYALSEALKQLNHTLGIFSFSYKNVLALQDLLRSQVESFLSTEQIINFYHYDLRVQVDLATVNVLAKIVSYSPEQLALGIEIAVFDFDNTLMAADQSCPEGFRPNAATLPLWMELFEALTQKGVIVLLMTSRARGVGERCKEVLFWQEAFERYMTASVFLSCATAKGVVLKELLQRIQYHYPGIVARGLLVDDQSIEIIIARQLSTLQLPICTYQMPTLSCVTTWQEFKRTPLIQQLKCLYALFIEGEADRRPSLEGAGEAGGMLASSASASSAITEGGFFSGQNRGECRRESQVSAAASSTPAGSVETASGEASEKKDEDEEENLHEVELVHG